MDTMLFVRNIKSENLSKKYNIMIENINIEYRHIIHLK